MMMKNIYLIYFILSISIDIYGQESKFVIKKGRDNTYEEYYVIDRPKKVKQGDYVKYRNTLFNGVQILETGKFISNQRSGQWEIFYDLPYNYSRNSIREKGSYYNGQKNGLWVNYYLDSLEDVTMVTKSNNTQKPDRTTININTRKLTVKSTGMYINGKQVGDWFYFDRDGNLFQKVNFDTGNVLFDASIKDSTEISRNRPSLFIGGTPSLIDYLSLDSDFFIYTSKIEWNLTSSTISFTIASSGEIRDAQIVKTNGQKQHSNQLLKLIKSTQGNWFPALSKSQSIDSNYTILIELKKYSSPSTSRNFKVYFRPILD